MRVRGWVDRYNTQAKLYTTITLCFLLCQLAIDAQHTPPEAAFNSTLGASARPYSKQRLSQHTTPLHSTAPHFESLVQQVQHTLYVHVLYSSLHHTPRLAHPRAHATPHTRVVRAHARTYTNACAHTCMAAMIRSPRHATPHHTTCHKHFFKKDVEEKGFLLLFYK